MDEKLEEKQSTDIKRMAAFIKHEAQEKASEIRQQALEEYNTEKARAVLKETEAIDRKHEEDIKALKLAGITSISDIKTNYRMDFLRYKENLMKQLFAQVKQKLKNQKLDKSLFIQSINSIEKKDLVLYVNDIDQENVSSWALESGLKFSLKKLSKNMLGGIIVQSVDGKVVCDNSYSSRIDNLMIHHLQEFSQYIFPE